MAPSIAALLVLAGLQDNGAREARELIEKLRSDRIEERDDATRRLKDLGKAGLAELEKASKGANAEVAARARQIARAIEVRGKLTQGLLKSVPGIDDRLASGEERAWTEAFFDAADQTRYPTLKTEDLDALALRGTRAAKTAQDKQAACEIIEKRKLKNAVPALVDIVEDEDLDVIVTITWALRRFEAKDALLKLLGHRNGFVRGEAAEKLGMIEDPAAAGAIAKLLKDPCPHARKNAAAGLGYLGAAEWAEQIDTLFKDPDDEVRAKAVEAASRLGAHRPPDVTRARVLVPKLLGLLNDDSYEVRRNAVEGLGWWGGEESIPELVKRLSDELPFVQGAAAEALARLGAFEAVPELVKLLDQPNDIIRQQVVFALADLDAREAIPDLLAMLPSGNRNTSVARLGQLRDPATAPAIAEVLKDEGAGTRGNAAFALGLVGRKDFIPDLIALLDDKDPYPRAQAVAALERLGAREALERIIPLLGDTDPSVRYNSLSAVAALGGKREAAKVIKLLGHPNRHTRWAAANALERVDSTEAVPALVPLLSDPDESVRRRTAEVLCAHGSREGVDVLFKDSGDLVVLNRLRRPETWEKLRSLRPGAAIKGSVRSVIEELVRPAGVGVEWPPKPSDEAKSWMAQRLKIRAGNPDTILDIVRSLWAYSAILERDRLRILSDAEAVAFWRTWWDDEKRRK